ncbi:MAG: aldehyde dehydrogenase family protein [Armatimonadetes bacterium]|nr:aldehyde dehydrogenase family protein [Armatimonadota bacterium]
MAVRLGVKKTYKQYIGGKFVRSESGRSLQQLGKDGEFIANYCHGSRKDLRDAVKAARGAFSGWSKRTAFNRGQILYRIAEMLEARENEFCDVMCAEGSATCEQNMIEIQCAVDRCVYYCGWADKFDAVFGSVNPVAADYFNFTVPEPTGVVGIVADEGTALIGLVSQIAATVVSGNACVVLASDEYPLTAMEFGEVLATSDVPGGVVNILSGKKHELIPHLAKHMDVNAIDYRDGDGQTVAQLIDLGTENVKRVRVSKRKARAGWLSDKAQGPEQIEKFVEMKTVWHPIGV